MSPVSTIIHCVGGVDSAGSNSVSSGTNQMNNKIIVCPESSKGKTGWRLEWVKLK